jgi:Family of unknown function (DUF6153)
MSSLIPVVSKAPRWLPGLRLAVVVLTVVALFGMHGLTSDHAMPGMLSAAFAHDSMGMGAHSTQLALESQRAAEPPATHPEHPKVASRAAGVDGGMAAGLCAAVLAGSLLLLLIRLLMRDPRVTSESPSVVAPGAGQPVRAQPARHLAPSLSRLCILRT